MPKIKQKKSWPVRYWVQILIFLATTGFTLFRAATRVIADADLDIIWIIGGAVLSATIFLSTMTTKQKEDMNKAVRESLLQVEDKFRESIEEIRSNLASIWTPTNKRNLEIAQEITRKVGKEGEQGLAYDTSSHCNPPEYEALVLDNLRKGVRYERLICFHPKDTKSEVKKWYYQLMDGKKKDKEGKFDEWRKMIKDDRLLVLHLPRKLDIDILVTGKQGTNRYDALLGFTTEDIVRRGVYTSGLYVPTPTQVLDKNLASDINSLFRKLWREAVTHAREQATKDVPDRCDCIEFIDKVAGDQVDIVPIDRPTEAKEDSSD